MGKKKKKSSSSSGGSFVVLLVLFIFIFFIMTRETKPIEYVDSLEKMEPPIQTSTTGSKTHKAGGVDVSLEYVASYSISGQIVYLQNHYGSDLDDKVVPIDVGIVWGDLQKDQDKVKFKITSQGFLDFTVSDTKWLESFGGNDKVISQYSNNRLIPSTSEIEKEFISLREGQHVKIEGYLVNASATDKDGKAYSEKSSTSRKDTGRSGNEVIYVTKLVWLEEKTY